MPKAFVYKLNIKVDRAQDSIYNSDSDKLNQ